MGTVLTPSQSLGWTLSSSASWTCLLCLPPSPRTLKPVWFEFSFWVFQAVLTLSLEHLTSSRGEINISPMCPHHFLVTWVHWRQSPMMRMLHFRLMSGVPGWHWHDLAQFRHTSYFPLKRHWEIQFGLWTAKMVSDWMATLAGFSKVTRLLGCFLLVGGVANSGLENCGSFKGSACGEEDFWVWFHLESIIWHEACPLKLQFSPSKLISIVWS